MDEEHTKAVQSLYNNRASSYDTATKGWHVPLANDMAAWLAPKPGDYILDLACGTGLVTIPLARFVGPSGKVIAVDITPQMVDVAKRKMNEMQIGGGMEESAEIEWLIEDITSERMLHIPSISNVLETRGGFDAISICSALVLLPDQKAALQFWVSKLLKKDGKLVADVPTEDLTTQFMLSHHLPVALGHRATLSLGRLWVRDSQSLAKMFIEEGLQPSEVIRTKCYFGETYYDGDDQTAERVLTEMAEAGKTPWLQDADEITIQRTKAAWLELWKQALTQNENGTWCFRDGHWLYVCVGRKL